MFTKRNLLNLFVEKHPNFSILQNRKEFCSGINSILRSQFGKDISEVDITNFVNTFSTKVCSFLKNKFRNNLAKLLISKDHVVFLENVIEFNSQFVQPRLDRPEVSVQTTKPLKSWLRLQLKRKRNDQAGPAAKKRVVGQRQNQSDAKEVRESAVSAESIHLASIQEHKNSGHWDAAFVARKLAENPEKYGPFLREACKSIDDEQKPIVPLEKSLQTLLHHNIPGGSMDVYTFEVSGLFSGKY